MAFIENGTNNPQWLDDDYVAFRDDTTPVRPNPYNPDEWLRQMSLFSATRHAGVSADTLLDTASEHFKQLEDLGVSIPRQEHFISDESFYRTGRPVKMGPTLYSVTEHIEGKRLDKPKDPEDLLVLGSFRKTIQKYTHWAETTAQPLALFDIGKMSQYILGKAAQDSEPKVYLVDVEPYMIPPRPDAALWQNQKNDLRRWENAAQLMRTV